MSYWFWQAPLVCMCWTSPTHHWESLLWLMHRAEESFKTIADHQVISHNHHAKNAVPFKTFSTSNPKSTSPKFFGGIAFGTNVFLWCHTNQDLTMSISQVFCWRKSNYHLNDGVIVYFCFPTLGILNWGCYPVLGDRNWSRGLVLCVLARKKLEKEVFVLS